MLDLAAARGPMASRGLALLFALGLAACSEPEAPAPMPERARATDASPTSSEVELASPTQGTEAPRRHAPAAAPGDATAPSVPAPFTLDSERPLRGRIVTALPLPVDESLEVVLLGLPFYADIDEALWGVGPGGHGGDELARVKAQPDGTFELPRPGRVADGSAGITIRAVGDYVYGEGMRYQIGTDDEPGDDPFDVHASVGAHVTARLDLEGIAAPEEIAALAGESMGFTSTTPVVDGRPVHVAWSGSSMGIEAPLDASGHAVFRGVDSWLWSESLSRDGDPPLAPFLIAPGFEFSAPPGERLVVDVPMQRGMRFSGRVLDPSGAPVPNAKLVVTMSYRNGSAFVMRPVYAETNDEGGFLFAALRPDIDSLEITCPGFPPFRLGSRTAEAVVLAGEPAEFVLSRGRSLRVHATLPAGRSVRALTVRAEVEGAPGHFTARTDEDGYATLAGLPDGDVVLTARTRTLVDAPTAGAAQALRVPQRPMGMAATVDPNVEELWWARVEVPGKAFDAEAAMEFRLAPAARVSGKVLGLRPGIPEPIAVHVFAAGEFPAFVPRGQGGTFRVNRETGRFGGPLLPGRYAFKAMGGPAPGQGPGTRTSQPRTGTMEVVVGAEDVELTLDFDAGAKIEGRVALEDGTPVPDTDVRMRILDGRVLSTRATTRTDAEGRFTFPQHPPGSYSIACNSQRHTQVSDGRVEISAGAPFDPIELVVAPGGAARIVGRAGDSPSASHEGRVGVYAKGGRPVNTRPLEDAGDWTGLLGPLAPGEYSAVRDVRVEGVPVAIRTRFEIVAGEVTDVTLAEPAGPTSIVSGVVTANGEPVEGLWVGLEDAFGPLAQGETDAAGRYTLRLTEPGPATLEVGLGPWSVFESSDVEIAGGPNTLPAIALPTGGIVGEIPQRQSMSFGAMPAAFRADGAPDDAPVRRATSMANGRFSLLYLPDGAYVVRMAASRDGAEDPFEPVAVTITGGEVVRDVKLKPRSK